MPVEHLGSDLAQHVLRAAPPGRRRSYGALAHGLPLLGWAADAGAGGGLAGRAAPGRRWPSSLATEVCSTRKRGSSVGRLRARPFRRGALRLAPGRCRTFQDRSLHPGQDPRSSSSLKRSSRMALEVPGRAWQGLFAQVAHVLLTNLRSSASSAWPWLHACRPAPAAWRHGVAVTSRAIGLHASRSSPVNRRGLRWCSVMRAISFGLTEPGDGLGRRVGGQARELPSSPASNRAPIGCCC